MTHEITLMSGRRFDYDAPAGRRIAATDLARALGNTCRFGGHVKRFYSVAEHAMLVWSIVTNGGAPADVSFAALHHDSHEAFIGDMPSPLKDKIKREAPGLWERMELEIDEALEQSFGVDAVLMHDQRVKAADKLALAYEGEALKPDGTELWGLPEGAAYDLRQARSTIRCYTPDEAARRFLTVHRAAAPAANYYARRMP